MNTLEEIISEMEEVTLVELESLDNCADTLGCGGIIKGGGCCGMDIR